MTPAFFFSALLKQLYIDQQYVPRTVYIPVDFADRDTLEALLSERAQHKVELACPAGEKSVRWSTSRDKMPSRVLTSASAFCSPRGR